MSSQVLDPLMPSLSSFCAVEKPGIPCKTGWLELLSDAAAPGAGCTHPESHARLYLLHDERRDAFLMRSRIRLCIHNQNVGFRAVGDPELVPVQNIIVA